MIRCALPILASLVLAFPAAAQTLTIQHDNDEWGGKGTDWEYSQGTRITYVSPKLAETNLAKTVALLLPGLDFDAELSAGLGMGSAYYEPGFLAATAPIPSQRPYAGYLYGSGLLSAEADNKLTTWRLDAGVVGPAAQGEAVTNFFHNVFSGNDQLGWDNQIENRLALNISAERRWRNIVPLSGAIAADISPAIGAELGTVSVAANAGLMLRIGTGLETDFGPPRIGAFSGSLASNNRAPAIYAFASANGSYAGYDVFLDEQGGSSDDPVRAGQNLTRDNWRMQASVGVVVSYGPLRGSLAITDASRTYDQQLDTERFSEMSLALRF
jgi:lipid A 3-O-deacylase